MVQRNTRRLDVTVASQRRRQIIEAAKACISEEGVEKTTLRNVARRADVSHATIAYYFKSRKAMVNAALVEAAEEFLVRLEESHKDSMGPQALIDMMTNFLNPENSVGNFVVELLDAGMHDPALRHAHVELMRLGGSWVQEAVRLGVESGHYRRDVDAQLAAAAFHGALLWVGFQMRSGLLTQERALSIAAEGLELLKPYREEDASPSGAVADASKRRPRAAPVTATDVIKAALRSDPVLSHEAAEVLTETLEGLYGLAVSASRARPNGHS